MLLNRLEAKRNEGNRKDNFEANGGLSIPISSYIRESAYVTSLVVRLAISSALQKQKQSVYASIIVCLWAPAGEALSARLCVICWVSPTLTLSPTG